MRSTSIYLLHNSYAWHWRLSTHTKTFTKSMVLPLEQLSVSCLLDLSIFISAAAQAWNQTAETQMWSPFSCFPLLLLLTARRMSDLKYHLESASESWLMYIFHDVRRHWLLNQVLTYIDRFTSTWLKLIQTMMTSHDTIFKKLRGSLNIQLLKVWLVGFVVWHKMTCNEQSWGPKQLVHKVRVWVY